MNAYEEVVDSHLAAYAEPDSQVRTSLVARAWSPEGRLVDPPLAAQGHAEIHGQAEALLSLYPGARFRRSSAVDAHHGFARYTWDLLSPAGEVLLSGTDVASFNDDNRLSLVVGFFGPLSGNDA